MKQKYFAHYSLPMYTYLIITSRVALIYYKLVSCKHGRYKHKHISGCGSKLEGDVPIPLNNNYPMDTTLFLPGTISG